MGQRFSILVKDEVIIAVGFFGRKFFLNQQVTVKSTRAFPPLSSGGEGQVVRLCRPYEEGRTWDIFDVKVGEKIFPLKFREILPC